MAVTLGRDVLSLYRRFSCYNSPFAAHDRGRAIDLYPDGESAPSPVSGTILETRSVSVPSKPYATDRDYLILIDTDEWIARVLHVEPAVAVGETVAVGDHLGRLVRSGYFAPWVPNHLHLGFRQPDQDPYRASGSVPLSIAAELIPLSWDGEGTVVAAGETWARLDEPSHPIPGEHFVGLASESGVLDGGFPHYDGGGIHGGWSSEPRLLGSRIGRAVDDGEPSGCRSPSQAHGIPQDVDWGDWTVLANGTPVTGLSLYCARDQFGATVVGKDLNLGVGDRVAVALCQDE